MIRLATLQVLEWFSAVRKYTRFRETLRLAQSSSREIRELQAQKLLRLIEHAKEKVPYYREPLASIDVKGIAKGEFAAIRQIPILRKSHIRSSQELLRSADAGSRPHLMRATGGSTGEPLQFLQETSYLSFASAIGLRNWSFAGWHPGARTVLFWGAPQETRSYLSFRTRFANLAQGFKVFDSFSITESNLSRWTEELLSWGPRFVNGYATSLATVANYILDRGIQLSTVQAVFSTAEKLHDWQRQQIEGAFGCKVYDTYGSREVIAIAGECSMGNMHVNTDCVYLEHYTDPCGVSRLLVTPLDNFVMPFIRYEIGDCGEILHETCACPLPFPLMKINVGRVTDNFITPEGKIVHGEYFTHLLYPIKGIDEFQFHQTERSRVVLRLITSESREHLMTSLDAIRQQVQREISPSMRLDIEFVAHIPRTATGKHLFTLSDVLKG